MAKITWLDSYGKRYKSEEYSDIKSFRSYIEENLYGIRVVKSLDCNPLESLYDDSTARGLFEDCINLEEVKDIIGTLQVKGMCAMFFGCSSLESVPYFDTPKVKNMCGMFSGCSKLESVPCFDTPKVTDMSYMFSRCSSLKIVPLLDTSNVEDMECMLANCSSLKFYTLPCGEYSTRSMAVKAYKGKKMLDMWDELFEWME